MYEYAIRDIDEIPLMERKVIGFKNINQMMMHFFAISQFHAFRK